MTAAELAFLRRVERGFCHALPVAGIGKRAMAVAMRLLSAGAIVRRAQRGRFRERFAVTSRGSWMLGTFDSSDRYFDEDVSAIRKRHHAA